MELTVKRQSALLSVVGSALVALCASAYAQTPNANLYVVHAAPGRNISTAVSPLAPAPSPSLPVDLSANGSCIAKGISYGDITGLLSLPAGPYTLQMTHADSTVPCSGSVVFTATLTLVAGSTYIGVLKVDAAGHPTGFLYKANLASIPPGSGRIELINASLDPVGVTLSTQGPFPVAPSSLTDFSPPPGIFTTTVLDSSGKLQVGPATVEVQQRSYYIYVIAGSVANGSIQWIGPRRIAGVF